MCHDLELRTGECETWKCSGLCESYADETKWFPRSEVFSCKEGSYELVACVVGGTSAKFLAVDVVLRNFKQCCVGSNALALRSEMSVRDA